MNIEQIRFITMVASLWFREMHCTTSPNFDYSTMGAISVLNVATSVKLVDILACGTLSVSHQNPICAICIFMCCHFTVSHK